MSNERPQRMCSIDFDEVEETGGAYIIMIDGDTYSLPKSQCELIDGEKQISVPHWLALKEGLI
jgi:hypothetical protein